MLVSSLANSTPTVMEGNAPAWFSDSLAMLQSSEIPLGEGWAELVQLWVAFEEKEGFKERRKLLAKDRPECITDWVRRARSPTWRPVITNVGAFRKVFHAWWVSLQPKWRVSGKGAILTEDVEGVVEHHPKSSSAIHLFPPP